MPRGSRPGERRGGRRRGTPNKATALKNAAICAAASGANSLPLDFILRLMRDPNLPADLRVDMAKSAAPFVHTRRKDQRLEQLRRLREHGGGLTRVGAPSQSSTRKMEGELLNGTAAAGGTDSSPLDYLLSVMNDADAKPGLRIKAARNAAPYLHAQPQPAKGIVIDDPFGFEFDPALARELRDEEVEYQFKMFVTEYPHFEGSAGERDLAARIKELSEMLPRRCPPGYTRLHAHHDGDRISEFFEIRRTGHKLTKEEDAEEAHLIARRATHALTIDATPEGRGRNRIEELTCRADLCEAEQGELDELFKRYPDLPGDRESRAIRDYLAKDDREEA
jgi:hypothetical protein